MDREGLGGKDPWVLPGQGSAVGVGEEGAGSDGLGSALRGDAGGSWVLGGFASLLESEAGVGWGGLAIDGLST